MNVKIGDFGLATQVDFDGERFFQEHLIKNAFNLLKIFLGRKRFVVLLII